MFFVILNYNSYNETLECIRHIRKLKNGNESKVVVVDNNTLKDFEKKEIEKISDKLIINNDNLGFAKGNNIGVNYIKENYDYKYIIVINSDVYIKQNDFLSRINDLYNKYNFDILGPKILPEETESVNPFSVYRNIEDVENAIKYNEKLLKIYNNCFLNFLLNIYLKIKYIFKKKKHLLNGEELLEDVPLHGCSLIFSKKYIEKYNDCFYDDTFLFHEEEFLYYRVNKDKLISVYSPDIEVYHLEGIATKNTFKNGKKNVFRTQEILKSLYKLKDVMINNKKI